VEKQQKDKQETLRKILCWKSKEAACRQVLQTGRAAGAAKGGPAGALRARSSRVL